MTSAILLGNSNAGNSHVRVVGAELASELPRCGSLLYGQRAIFCKQVVLSLAMLSASVMYGASLKWTGEGDGTKWSDSANWDATPDWSIANDLDFTAVAGGKILDNDATLTVGAMAFGENKGTITLTRTKSGDFYPADKATWTVPAGTIIDAQFTSGSTVSWTSFTVTVTGGGTLWINGAWASGYSSANYTFDGVTVRLKKAPNCICSGLYKLTNGAKFYADVDFTYGTIQSTSAAETFDVGTHTATFKRAAGEFAGVLAGTGTINCEGANSWKISGTSPDFTGTLRILNANVELTGSLGAAAKIENVDAGTLKLPGSVTFGGLSGTATRGGAKIPANATLTVKGTASDACDTYGGRLTGEGGLTLDASGKSLTLSGANSYAGATTVAAGTLRIADPNAFTGYPQGLVSRYSFDDGLLTDDLGNYPLEVTSGSPYVATDGVSGSCVHFTAPDKENSDCLKTVAGSFIKGSQPFTVSYWIRTNVKSWVNVADFMYVGTWNSGGSSFVGHGATTTTTPGYPDGTVTTVQGNWVYNGIASDGQWHHYALAFDGMVLKFYIDGKAHGTTWTKEWNIANTKLKIGDRADGDFDEILVFNRCLDAEEIASLKAVPVPSATGELALPSPVAHWAFDDAENPGKDSSGNGYDLTVQSGTATLYQPAGVYGQAFKTSAKAGGSYFKWTGDEWPAKIPSGTSSFTVTVRVYGDGGDQGVDIFSMGDVTTANRMFRVGNGGYPRRYGYSVTTQNSDVMVYVAQFSAATWADYAFVYDAGTGKMSIYQDGVLMRTDACAPNIDANGSVYVAYSSAKNRFDNYIDDIQVFDVALTAAQVRNLVQTLDTGVSQSVLPSGTELTVADGAVFSIPWPTTVSVAGLAGAGTLKLTGGSSLDVDRVSSGFTGSIVGAGSLGLAENAVLTCSTTTPAIATTGTVALPKNAKVVLSDLAQVVERMATVHATVVSAGALSGETADLSGWSVEGLDLGHFKVRFTVDGGDVLLTVKPRGFVLHLK